MEPWPTSFAGGLFFLGADDDHGMESSEDGRLPGHHDAPDRLRLRGNSLRSPRRGRGRLDGILYLAVFDSTHATHLWRTDGTPAGTRELALLSLGDSASGGIGLVPLGGRLFYAGHLAGETYALWAFDPLTETQDLLASFPLEDLLHSIPTTALVPHQGELFFTARDPARGIELWKTDGTATGTVLVRDIQPGGGSAVPKGMVSGAGRLFFSAEDGLHGSELWVTEGTAAGTRLVQDIAPAAASSSPEQLTVAGDRLFFTADDGLSGRELWSLPLGGPAGPASPRRPRLCLSDGRFPVEVDWRDFQGNRGAGHAAAADRRHRLLLVLRPGQRRGDRQGARRPRPSTATSGSSTARSRTSSTR